MAQHELLRMPENNPDLAAVIGRILPDIVETRHHLHQNPEISGEEAETSAFVADRLAALGLDDLQTGVGGYGVVGLLRGPIDGPTFALRADMDALPIQETSTLPYKSCKPGTMHACGHDGHTATLLGAATALAEVRSQIRGAVKFIFQPAEETTGGAERMCAEGVMDGVDAIAALHGWPFLGVGQIGLRPGPTMASADTFHITIRGKGAHAAYPHLSVDPIIVSASCVQALQTLSSREISPLDSVVVSVTKFHAGTAHNVIASSAQLTGTVRCLNPSVRDQMRDKMERIIAGICAAFRAEYDLAYDLGPPVTVNDPGMSAFIEQVGRDVLGPENVHYLEEPSMGAEDFAYYLPYAPGAMFRLGVGLDMTALHTPTYNFVDEALPNGIRMFCELALRFQRP